MKTVEYNLQTRITTERELTAEEIAQLEAMQQIEPTLQQPTLEERVADIEQVTAEVINALNDKGIVQ